MITKKELFQVAKQDAMAFDERQAAKKSVKKNILQIAVEKNLKGRL